ncbi:MAG: ribonuclease R [Candidatus Latescibacteria bacterium]|nr:ribonuclease R [Candidatus Latescibacterota bacterium]
MRSPEYRPLRIRELARSLAVRNEGYRSFRRLVAEMVEAGEVVELRRKQFALPGSGSFIVGLLHGHQGGFGFVTPDAGEPDVFIGADSMGQALHGDKVLVRLYGRRRGLNPEGEIVRVLERGRAPIVGLYRREGTGGYVIPDDTRITRNILIARRNAKEAQTDQKVVVHVTNWDTSSHLPEGRITEVLGFPDDPGLEILSLIRSYDLPLDFPDPVLDEAERFPASLPHEALVGRVDLRSTRCITIDPVDARDFDDAVSIQRLPNGHYRLGVHIADVGSYVREGSLIDREALYRGTSIYLVDRVIPMLPHRLTNDICSLKPGVDRLTMSVWMEVAPSGEVVRYEIRDSVIRSAYRLTYEEAQEWVETGDPHDAKTGAIVADLRVLLDLSVILRGRRVASGSLDFDLPEPFVLLDPEGKPLDVRRAERLASHRLIEECMLLANQTVAGHLLRLGIPALYRVHARPSPDRLKELQLLLAGFGYTLTARDVAHPKKLQAFLESIKDQPDHVVINDIVLRSLKKAQYAVDNIGHYGLAFDWYTHFTSPIRRYPDLAVHRLLRELQPGLPQPDRQRQVELFFRRAAEIASRREKLAEEVERESVKIKQVEFMEGKIGEVYEGIISGVVQSGLFVELEDSLINGLVHTSTLTDDYYVFDRDRRRLIGERTKRVFRLGDRVRVRVTRADRRLRRIDFELVDEGARAVRVVDGEQDTRRVRGRVRKGRPRRGGIGRSR